MDRGFFCPGKRGATGSIASVSSSRGEVENFSRGSITVTCINGGKRFVLSSGVAIMDTVCDFFVHVGSVAASEFFKNPNSKHFFPNP